MLDEAQAGIKIARKNINTLRYADDTALVTGVQTCALPIFMRNAMLDEAQAGIKIMGRNINNLRYADDTTLIDRKSVV